MSEEYDQPHEYPIDGTLDLHLFAPGDTKEVVLEYIDVCLQAGMTQIRIVHGKGIGVKRRIVHSILEAHPRVANFYHEGGTGGSWGATVVNLKK